MQYSQYYPLIFPIVSHNKTKSLIKESSIILLFIGLFCSTSFIYFNNIMLIRISIIIAILCFIIYTYFIYAYKTFNAKGFVIFQMDSIYIKNNDLENNFNLIDLKNNIHKF